ncbi:IS110 family transposase [Acetivibrio clariflavus]|uniref:Transposase n=1 Tax=Acetivibrio clariflavus (strain DSM 19732 / NBRC 101661 / EBR45) TaxID=720554 RepID=G8LUG9_ACECE|nr:IS110 family transposase [Acetivibrio clariflavus]AEV70617.1 transposase [Acetivibrio clariflavus DSM 19732]
MKYTQNEKIMQIKETTLIIGIDVDSEKHYARAFSFRDVEYGKLLIFNNSAEGFAKLKECTGKIAETEGFTEVILGMEPTGHYWFNLAENTMKSGMRIVLVNPHHVKKSKELDDNNPTKSDRKDPKTIAMLVKDGRYIEPYIPEGIYKELRSAMDSRWRLVKEISAVKNRISRWISIHYPEFIKVFGNWEGKAALLILKECPTPKKVVERGIEGIIAIWKEHKIRAVGIKRAVMLVESAKISIGTSEGLISAENEISMLLEDYERKMRQLERTMVLIEEMAMQISEFEKLLEIKGVGLVIAAGFLAEVGDILRFKHPKQIQKLSGLSLKENSSGKHKGQTTICKRGRKRLRYYLTFGIMPLLSKNEEFRALHQYYTTRKERPLKKKQSMIALSNKLIRIFYAILTKDIAYDSQKMMSDIKRPEAKAVA